MGVTARMARESAAGFRQGVDGTRRLARTGAGVRTDGDTHRAEAEISVAAVLRSLALTGNIPGGVRFGQGYAAGGSGGLVVEASLSGRSLMSQSFPVIRLRGRCCRTRA